VARALPERDVVDDGPHLKEVLLAKRHVHVVQKVGGGSLGLESLGF
jgi:hypothetical protein